MAILFKQSKNKERVFTWIVVLAAIFILFAISLFFFPPYRFPTTDQGQIFDQYDVKIDLSLLNSDKVKNLSLFSQDFPTEFAYTAKDKNGKQITGTILAADQVEVASLLASQGLTVVTIQGNQLIKSDPFYPYSSK